MNNALRKSQADNGAFSTWEGKDAINVDKYFKVYWQPYFTHLQYHDSAVDIGYESTYPWKNLNGDKIGWNVISHPTRVLFTLADGTVVFYPISTTDINGKPVYVNSFYVDINGPQKPNILGRDVFMLAVVDYGGVKGHCAAGNSAEIIDHNCSKKSNGNENCCAAKIIKDGWQIRNGYPW